MSMKELVNKTFEIPMSCIGQSASSDCLPVKITIRDFMPDYCGQECYSISTGWTDTTVLAWPIYAHWFNVIRRAEHFASHVGLPVFKMNHEPEGYTVSRYGSVENVVDYEQHSCLHIRLPDVPVTMPAHVLSPREYALYVCKAGQLHDLSVNITQLGLHPDDSIVVWLTGSHDPEKLHDRIDLAPLFLYGQLGTMRMGPAIIDDRIKPSTLASRSACFNMQARHLYKEAPDIGNARCKAMAYDQNNGKLFVKVLSCESMPDKVGDVISLDGNTINGLITRIEMTSLSKVSRPLLTRDSFTPVLESQKNHIEQIIQRKGYGVYASRHELLGVIQDEVVELRDAIHDKESEDRIISELQDIATGCLWGIASIRSGAMSW